MHHLGTVVLLLFAPLLRNAGDIFGASCNFNNYAKLFLKFFPNFFFIFGFYEYFCRYAFFVLSLRLDSVILRSIFDFSSILKNVEIVEKLVNFGDFENEVGKEEEAVGYV